MILNEKSCTLIESSFSILSHDPVWSAARTVKTIVRSIVIVSISILCSTGATAQDFQSSYRDYDLLDFRSLGAGAAANTFEARGDNVLSDSLRIQFSTPALFLEYRQMDIRIAVSYSHYTLHGAGMSSYAIYAEGSTDLAIAAGRSGGLYLPFIIATNYVRADGIGSSSSIFDVGSVGVGAGLKYRYLSETFGLQAYAGAVIHYSTVGFSIDHGSSSSGRGELELLFPELVWKGAVIGYRVETQQWIMTDAKLNYRRLYHGAFVGLLF